MVQCSVWCLLLTLAGYWATLCWRWSLFFFTLTRRWLAALLMNCIYLHTLCFSVFYFVNRPSFASSCIFRFVFFQRPDDGSLWVVVVVVRCLRQWHSSAVNEVELSASSTCDAQINRVSRRSRNDRISSFSWATFIRKCAYLIPLAQPEFSIWVFLSYFVDS